MAGSLVVDEMVGRGADPIRERVEATHGNIAAVEVEDWQVRIGVDQSDANAAALRLIRERGRIGCQR